MAKPPRKRPYTYSERKIRHKERMSNYYLANKDKLNAKSRDWLENNREHKKKYQRNQNYMIEHGISLLEAELILKNQDSKCVICNNLISFGGRAGANIDHCHITNKIRGVLCHNCNKGLGNFKDNTNSLLSAINYLKKKKFILLINPFEKIAG